MLTGQELVAASSHPDISLWMPGVRYNEAVVVNGATLRLVVHTIPPPPVAPVAPESALLTGDEKPAVHVPLTNGFARTGYEQDLAQGEEAEAVHGKHP